MHDAAVDFLLQHQVPERAHSAAAVFFRNE